jgi:hypothetical protein
MKCLRLKAANSGKFIAAFCRFSSPPARLRQSDLYDRKGMVSRRKTLFLMVRINAVSWLA